MYNTDGKVEEVYAKIFILTSEKLILIIRLRICFEEDEVMVSIDMKLKERFLQYLREREYSSGSILKYMRNFDILAEYAGDCPLDKERLPGFRQFLLDKNYSVSAVNSALGTVNKLFEMLETAGDVTEKIKLRYERIQYQTFISADKELTDEEYKRMVRLAEKKGDTRLSMILQTVCSLGLRVSELKAITVESLSEGKAIIRNKRKERVILIPEKLTQALRSYCAEKKIVSGMIFITRTGRALDRSNIWKMIKSIGKAAGVAEEKAFPHNLRHLFARTYYQIHRDLGGLASILGHSSVDTTRIYTANSGEQERRNMNQLGLVIS